MKFFDRLIRKDVAGNEEKRSADRLITSDTKGVDDNPWDGLDIQKYLLKDPDAELLIRWRGSRGHLMLNDGSGDPPKETLQDFEEIKYEKNIGHWTAKSKGYLYIVNLNGFKRLSDFFEKIYQDDNGKLYGERRGQKSEIVVS